MTIDFVIEQTKSETIPAGKYAAKVENVELEEGGKFGDQVKISFNIPAGEDHPERDIYGWASKKFTCACKLYKWTAAILGPIAEDYAFKPGDIVGKWCYLILLEEINEKGATFNKIADLMPYKKAKTQAPPPPPADADY